MRAFVCDKCGKVVLLAEDGRLFRDEGINRLTMVDECKEIDLCNECTNELLAAIRKGE